MPFRVLLKINKPNQILLFVALGLCDHSAPTLQTDGRTSCSWHLARNVPLMWNVFGTVKPGR